VSFEERERSAKESKKLSDEAVHKIHQLMQRWEQRITIHNLCLADRFLDFELQILLHFIAKDTGEMRVACFHQVAGGYPVGDKEVVAPNGEQGAVLINVIKLVESPERVIPAFVGLESIDDFYRIRPDTLYFSSLCGFVSSRILRNRKLDLTARLNSGISNHGEVVERTPEIVDDISGSGDCVPGQNRELSEILGYLSRLRIELAENRCLMFIPKSNEFSLKITEMLLGPFNFYANKNKSVGGGQRHLQNDTSLG